MKVPGVPFVQGRNRYGTSAKYAVAIHATANTASAANEAAYATRRTDGTSAHFYVDGREIIQSLDTADVAGHAGSWQGNQYSIAVEITGLTSWSRQRWLDSVAWDKLAAVLAAVAKHYGIPATRATVEQMRANPRVRGVYDHNQMRLAWGGTDHTDPGPNFPWDHLLTVWQRALGKEDKSMATAKELVNGLMSADVVPNDINPGQPGKPGHNPEMTVRWALRYATHATLAHREAKALRTDVAALASKIDRVQAPEIDYDRLAAALLRRIAGTSQG